MSKSLKINLVCIDNGVISVGYRRMASWVKTLEPGTISHYIAPANSRSWIRNLLGSGGEAPSDTAEYIHEAASLLADADIVGVSSMSVYAILTERLFAEIRRINPKTFLVWGGAHPIIDPDGAIPHADAICTGEGEFAFREFLDAFREGRDYTGTPNFWFRSPDQIIRNGFLPLMTAEQMTGMPLMEYGEHELLFRQGRGFAPMTPKDYFQFAGLGYNTIWSIGCPFECTYCGNTKFIENDKMYRKLRHPGVDYIIREVQKARAVHPHIASVVFHDDSFMAIRIETLREFSEAWKREVDLPFAVLGVIPSYVKKEKYDLLVWAGMQRVRMGIQSGSKKILDFFKRPTDPVRVAASADICASYAADGFMIPPSFDFIVDNPVEEKEDIDATLKLIYGMKRPFSLNLFSLRVIPNTELERQIKAQSVDVESITRSFFHIAPIFSNLCLYVLATFRPPKRVFEWMIRRALPIRTPQPTYPLLALLFRFVYFARRALDHVRFMDFSVLTGTPAWLAWKLGLVSLWRRFFARSFPAPAAMTPTTFASSAATVSASPSAVADGTR